MRLRLRTRSGQFAVVALVLGAAIGSGCASSSADESALKTSGGFGTGGGTKQFVEGGPPSRGGAPGGGALNALCGHDFDCRNPDDPSACKDFSGSVKPIDAGHRGAGGASSGGSVGTGGVVVAMGGTAGSARDAGNGEAGTPRDGSAGGLDASDASDVSHRDSGPPVDASFDGTTSDHSTPELDSGSDTGGSSNSGQPDAYVPPIEDAGRRYSCQVALPASSGAGGSSSAEPFSQCLPAGDRKSGQPCSYSDQCRPGLACVGLPNAGQCWPYCCDPATSCEKAWVAGGGSGADSAANLYCGVRSLVEGPQKSTLSVPVCVPADRCTLEDPYPCTGSSCQCHDGKACTVKVIQGDGGNTVRGTTICAVPGKGRTNEPCNSAKPCAAGYFCSESSGVCLKMCRADGHDTSCAPGHCQQTYGFPDQWGVCVGAAPAAK